MIAKNLNASICAVICAVSFVALLSYASYLKEAITTHPSFLRAVQCMVGIGLLLFAVWASSCFETP